MARKRKRAVSASPDSSGDDDDGIIDLSQEPKPTTDVIPYENGTDIVGKRIQMLYEYTDEDTGATSFRFYRGVVGRKVGAAGNTYRLDFDDGEKKTVNLTKPSETIRWETGDITRGGRWKTAKDAGIADVVKSPERQRGKAKEWWKEGAPQSEGGERNEPAFVNHTAREDGRVGLAFEDERVLALGAQVEVWAGEAAGPTSIFSGRVSAVEGTQLSMDFQLNKPVKSAVLVARDEAKTELPLTVTEGKASVSLPPLTLAESRTFDLRLVDADGRANKTALPDARRNQPLAVKCW